MSATSKKQITKKLPSEVKEVGNFLESFGRLEAFRAKNAETFAQYEQLVADYNQKLEDAERICRQQRIACGPFDLYNFSTQYDPKALYDMIGHERFLGVGGSTRTETVYVIDKVKVEIAIQQDRIPRDVVEVFKKTSPSFHKPEKITT